MKRSLQAGLFDTLIRSPILSKPGEPLEPLPRIYAQKELCHLRPLYVPSLEVGTHAGPPQKNPAAISTRGKRISKTALTPKKLNDFQTRSFRSQVSRGRLIRTVGPRRKQPPFLSITIPSFDIKSWLLACPCEYFPRERAQKLMDCG